MRSTVTILRALLAFGMSVVAVGCSSTVEIPSAASAARTPLHVGTWRSELDDTRLTVRADGAFEVERPATESEPARRVVGRWRAVGDALVFVNAADAPTCAGVEGRYGVRVVRDTARFVEIDDDCPAREDHMAWPWKRAEKP